MTGTSELRVDLVDFDGNHRFAKYSSFKMAGEADKYRLVLGTFVDGSAGERPPWATWPGAQSRERLLRIRALRDVGRWRPCKVPCANTAHPHLMVPMK